MSTYKSIFDTLFEKKICFAVIVSLVTFRCKSIQDNSKVYSVYILEPDLKKLKSFKFKKEERYPNLYEMDLHEITVDEFKRHMDKFVKVQHCASGRVYELKNNSFKKMYESLVESKFDIAIKMKAWEGKKF
jgi:hypothetical protein